MKGIWGESCTLTQGDVWAVDGSLRTGGVGYTISDSDVCKKAIEPAIRKAGYEPLRIDKKDYNNKIDDQIVAEIKRSRFLVADFTHGDEGMRGGVYYEAGLAHGLGLPVIFTCRDDMLKKIHFDTRQYNHIVWKKDELDAFCAALSNRISATIGDGPHRKKPHASDDPQEER